MANVRLRRSLASQLLLLTMAVALMSELLVLLPWLARERDDWLEDRVTQSYVAALAIADGHFDDRERVEIFQAAGVVSAQMVAPRGPPATAGSAASHPAPVKLLDLRTETALERIRRVFVTLLRTDDPLLMVISPVGANPATVMQMTVHEGEMARDLRAFALRATMVSLALIAAIGATLYLTLLRVLVRPMRQLTESIAAFRADPDHTALPGPPESDTARHNEIGDASRELAALQREMRTALWRNARLAALGTAVAKVSHDLRGTLAPALLAAERLVSDPDPAVRQTGNVLMRAIDRTTEIFTRTLEFSRDTPFAPVRSRFALEPLIEEAAEVAGAVNLGLTVTITGAIDGEIEADRMQLLRILANLLRNAGEAHAPNATVEVMCRPGATVFIVADDGPGLPASVQKDLFRPFVRSSRSDSTGLGLAIVRDLVLAQGGTIVLEMTGPSGTRFRISIPDASMAALTMSQPLRRPLARRELETPDSVTQRIKRTV